MATNVGEIQVVATLDSAKFKSGLSGMESDAKNSTNKIGDSFKGISNSLDSTVKDLLGKASKAAGAAAVAIGSGAIKGFSDWQQFTGGIDKLFGNASQTVQKNAAKAYKTAGMSANDYMDTATSFSASLIKGLNGDTAKAANIADEAIQDMSDNANTFGTSMDSIQYAYQGFAKQNYTMLDNLKLGYGGTASEMARLVNDSGVMGKNFKANAKNINDVSFDKIIEAIHVTQERLKIAGTTSNEGAKTVEGSFNQMKSAAQNFLTALGGGGNAQQAFQELLDATKQFGENLKPVIRDILTNVGAIIDEYIPGFTDGVKQVLDFVKNNKQLVIDAIKSIGLALLTIRIGTFIGDLSKSIGNIKDVAKGAGGAIKFIWSGNDKGFGGLVGMAKKLAPLLSTVGSGIASIATTVGGVLVTAIQGVGSALGTVGAFLAANPIVLIIGAIIAIVVALVALYNKSEGFRELVNGIVSAVIGFIQGAIATVVSFFQGMWDLITGVIGGIVGFVQGVWGAVVGIVSGIAGWINDNIIQPVVGFISGLWNDITTGVQNVWNGAKNIVSGIANWIKTNVIDKITGFFQAGWDAVRSGVDALKNGIKTVFGTIAGIIKNPINTIIDGINAVIKKINGLKVPDWVPVIGGSHTNFPTIPKLATGGYVDGIGTGTSDSNMAWLSRGEYVVRADTVRRYGVEFMDALNNGSLAFSGGTTQNFYYQFDRNANSRWQYQQIRTGAAA